MSVRENTLIRGRNVRRSGFAAACAVATVGIALSLPGPAAFAGTQMTIESSAYNWFWSSNSKITVCQPPPAPVPGVPTPCVPVDLNAGVPVTGTGAGEASPISTGHIAVSMKAGNSDMRAYVRFDDVSKIPLGAKVDSFIVSLLVSDASQMHSQEHTNTQQKPPATSNENAAVIQACALTQPLAATQDGGDPPYSTFIADATQLSPTDPNKGIKTTQSEPASDCSLNATGVRGEAQEDGSHFWTFDITKMANAWVSGQVFNNGIALLPVSRGLEPTWTVEFHGGFARKSTATGTPQIIVTHKEAAHAMIEYEGGALPPPPPTPPVPPPPTVPSFQQQPPAPPSAPTVDNPSATSPGQFAPVGKSHPRMPWYVWLLLPVGAAGLGLTRSAIEDDLAPASAMNRVAGLLRSRRLAGGEGVGSATEAIAAEEEQILSEENP